MPEQKINRRGFLRLGNLSPADSRMASTQRAAAELKLKRRFIRPPGAVTEADFLSACTRCGKCGQACEYEAIDFIDDEKAGFDHETPIIDVFTAPCHYCADTPCITACEPQALRLMEQKPRMGVAEFHPEHCFVTQGQHCDYCFRTCPPAAKAISKSPEGTPVIDESICVGCGKCAYICVSMSGKALTINFAEPPAGTPVI